MNDKPPLHSKEERFRDEQRRRREATHALPIPISKALEEAKLPPRKADDAASKTK